MSKYSKINVISNLQKWMDSENGQTFLNYAYSWGASIVILGTLFKLTHMPSANFWLFLGMGTEVRIRMIQKRLLRFSSSMVPLPHSPRRLKILPVVSE